MSADLAAAGIHLPDDLAATVVGELDRAEREDWVGRTWGDPGLWSTDPAVQDRVANRLGWLHAPEEFLDQVEELEAFASGVRDEGFEQAVLCGMGGSSLAPLVLAQTYGVGPHGMPLVVLDSTDPDAVARTLDGRDPSRTLYVVSSKSGTTTETLSLLALFWHEVGRRRSHRARDGEHFVAISDPGRSLEAIPHSDEFRSVFLNPPDVGGRYSALTYVGLVPAALLGLDLRGLLASAVEMSHRCREEGAENPGLALGITLGTLARLGRDKLTFLADPAIATFGMWAEQLIAESTGKEGVGIVPVDAEPLGPADRYGTDRVFVRLHAQGGAPAASDALAADLRSAGHPVIDLQVDGEHGLGGEFFRWEYATAIAGVVLGINPFDEPNVTESKDNTRRVLAAFHAEGELPLPPVLAVEGLLSFSGDETLAAGGTEQPVEILLRGQLDRVDATGYLALQAYLAPTPGRDAAIAALRLMLRDRTGRATTAGYGPRYLHSTGQLHKGGPATGWFLQLVGRHPRDLLVPDAHHTFGTLIDAQALGDFSSLEAHGLPVLRVDLSDDPDAGLEALRALFERVL
jgi:transaldolase / glucose-6-phosphate isomerase